MNPQKWFRLSGSVASAAVIFLLSSASLVSGILAQSTGTAIAGPPLSGVAQVPFLVAPSFSLAGSPTGVASGDLNQDGKLDLVTTDSASGKVTVFLGIGNGKFAPGVDYAAGLHPTSIVVADIDGDGRLDVIVGDETAGTISVLSGSGNGKLQPATSYAVGLHPAFLATGDLNGDGKTDVVAAAKTGNSLALLLNDGKGNLGKPILTTLHKTPTSLVVADLNNDEHLDLALANSDGSVSILLGAGNGTFHSLPDISVASGSLSSIIAGDFNRDGNVDLAVTTAGEKTLSVLLGKGNGGFTSPEHYSVGINPVSTIVADLDGDGIADLIVINQGSNTFSVLGGNGDGTFRAPLDFVAGNGPVAAAAGDFDGDGHVDLAVLNSSSQSVSVALGNGDGTFKTSRSYAAGSQPRAVASADLNGDKLPDLVVANYCGPDAACTKGGSVAIFLAGKDGNYQLSNTYPLGAGPVSVALVDVNGDNIADIVALNRDGKTVSVLLGKGDGSFEQPTTLSVSDSPIAVAVGDFNKDGKPDLAVIEDCGAAKCTQPGTVEILLGHGGGDFRSAVTYAVGYSPTSLAVGDLNNDKNLDIIVANRCGADASCNSPGTATALLGTASGKFTAAADISVGNSPSSIALGDLSGRGVLDLLVSSSSDNSVAVLRGKGDGSFGASVAYKVGNSPGSVVIADFNGDGKPDVAVANVPDSTVSVLFGKGDGTLNTSFALPVGTGPAALADVATTNSRHASLATANGNTGSTTLGTDITVLANIQPDSGPSITPTIAVARTTGASSTVYGTELIYTATVTGTALALQPAGTVEFNDSAVAGNPSLACVGPTDLTLVQNGTTNSTTTCTISTLTGGSHSITGTYTPATPDPTYLGAGPSTPAVAQTITQATPSIAVALTAGSASVAYGTSLTFTATVSGGAGLASPTGTVTFDDGITALSCSNTVTLVSTGPATGSSSAICTISTLGVGPHSINATYTPGTDPNYLTAGPSTPSVSETVTTTTPAIAVARTVGSASSVYGTPLSFTATVSGGAGLAAPTGTIAFDDGATPLSCSNTVTLTPTGAGTGSSSATCNISTLTGGSHSINATYTPAGADPNYLAAGPSTPSVSQTITQATPTIAVALTSGNPSSTFGASLTFTTTVTGGTGLAAPTGTVTFDDGTTPLVCSNTVTLTPGAGNSKATCTITTLTGGSHNINATYTPANTDLNYLAAGPSTPSVAQAVTTITTATALSSSAPTSSNVDDLVTFTASVTSTPALTPTPTGTVSFTLNGNPISSCTAVTKNVSGFWTCTTQALVAPADVIDATYNGDANYAPSTAPKFTQSVNQIAATTTLASSVPTSSVNQTVLFTATVKPLGVASPAVLPGGSVTFKQGTTILCSAGLAGSPATASCSYAFSAIIASPGAAITATYSGDANFTAGAPGTANQIVKATNTTSAIISSSPSTSNVNQLVVFTATLTPAYTGSAVPQAGTMTFIDTSTTPNITICTETVTNGVVPTCSYAFTSSGPQNITATFASQDPNFNSSNPSGPYQQTVNSAGTTVSLTSSPSASVVDQSVTFSAIVGSSSGGAAIPQGTVTYTDTFNNPHTLLCTVTLAPAGTVPSCPAVLLTPGTHTIIAAFTPSTADFGPASSPTYNQVVNKGVPTVGLVLSPTPSSVDQNVTFTSGITPPYLGTTLPTGSVTFSYAPNGAAITLCTANVNPTGTTPIPTSASCSAPFTAAGAYTVTATYSGDANFTAGTPTPQSQTVNKTTAVVRITSLSPASSSVNQAVTFTASVAKPGADIGSTLPTGTVAFSDTTGGGSAQLCTATIIASTGIASCSGAFATVGPTRTVTAVYSGDPNFAAAVTPSTATQPVTPANVTAAVTSSSPSAPTVNQAVTFTATLTSVPLGTVVPQAGTVAFIDASTTPAITICPAEPVTNGAVQSCTYTFTSSGNHLITATFTTADPNFNSSNASPVYLQVVAPSTTKVILTATPTSATVNTNVTLNSTVTSTQAGSAIPQGTVVYTDTSIKPSATTLCTETLTATGTVPTCTTALAIAATHTIVAAFTPTNSNFGPATSASANLTITQATPTIAFSSLPTSPVSVDQPVTYTVTLTQTPAGTANSAGVVTYPTGTITFSYILNNVATIVCNTSGNLTTTGSITTAVCPFTFPAAASAATPYTVTASYSGDTNFVAGTPATTTQAVSTSGTSVNFPAPSPASSSVNQPITFTASVASIIKDSGLTLPTGNFTFSDTTSATAVPLCTASILTPSTGAATCTASLHSKGTHTITATYDGDTNFSVSSATQTQTVVQSSPVIRLTGPIVPVVATQAVNFTATVSPAVTGSGATAPSGTIVFTSSDGSPNSCSTAVTSPGDGTITNTCQFAFLRTTAGPVTVTASFVSADTNFASGTATLPQTVENFSVAFSPSAAITLSQGYASNTDPFNPVAISVKSTPASGYSDPLAITCQVQNSSNAVVSDPSCVASPTTLPGSGASSSSFTVTASAAAPVDVYTVTLAATDTTFPNLFQTTTLQVNVVNTSGTVSLAPGSSATQTVAFDTAPPTGGTRAGTLTSFACGSFTTVASPSGGILTASEVTCAGPVSPVQISGNSTTAAITITVNGSTTTASSSQTQRPGSITTAAFWGVPLLALLAWVSRRKSPRRNFFRFLGMLLLVVGLSHTIGCGGSFTRPPTVTGGPPVGSYLIQVVATDSNGINHYAVVPLVVN